MKKLAMKMLSLLLVLSLLLPTCVFAQPGQDGDGTPGTQGAAMENADTPTGGGNSDGDADAPTGGGNGDGNADVTTGGGNGDETSKDENGGGNGDENSDTSTGGGNGDGDADTPAGGGNGDEDADVSAEEAAPTVVEMEEVVLDLSDMDLPDNDELFAAYVEREFDRAAGGMQSPVFYSSSHATRPLNDTEKKIYNALKTEIEKIANGTVHDTQINVTITWTAAELGGTDFSDATTRSRFTTAAGDWNIKNVSKALLADCAYELYWYDKTQGVSVPGYTIAPPASGGTATQSYTVKFYVAKAYSAANAVKTYVTRSDLSAVNAAVSKAGNIVTTYAGKSDDVKLDGYFAEIRTLVDYNYDALAEGTLYGDPWQMIYVFDNDPATKVVCEGYAKAFQYLCEKSSPQIKCYNVTGKMNGGDHMWNVVEQGGTRYLVDVTNCDDGEKDGSTLYGYGYMANPRDCYLYMKTGSPSTDGKTHTFTFHNDFLNSDYTVTYVYEDSMKDLFCAGYPKLGTEVKHTVTITKDVNMTVTSGSLSQEVLNTAPMTEVILTAADGYYFPVGYTVPGSSGVTVTRLDYRQIKVSGTPTADATITLTAPTAKTYATLTTAPAANTGLKYTGNAQELVTAGSGVTGGTLQYSLSSGTGFSTAIPKGTNAGNYLVYYKVVGDDTHIDTTEITINVTIGQKTPEASNFVFEAPSSLGYDGNDKAATVTLKSPYSDAGNGITIKYAKSGTTVTNPKDVGEYTVSIDYKGGTNFESKNGLTDGMWKFTIVPGVSSITITGNPSKIYDGNVVADPAVSKSGSAGAVTYTYYTNAACTIKTNNANNGAASDGAAPKNAGDYWVKATLAADSNYGSAISDAKKFTIGQKPLTNDMINLGTQKAYDGTEQHVQIASVKDGTALLIAGGHDYRIVSGDTATDVGNTTLVIEGKGNYTGEASAAWSLKPRDVTITPDAKSKTYGEAEPELTFTTSIDGNTPLKNKFLAAKSGEMSRAAGEDVGSYAIKLGTLAAGGNFKLTFATTTVYLAITPKNVSGLTADISNQTTIKGVGEFVDPVIKGVNGEDLTGTLTYAYDSVSGKTHADVVAMLKTKATNDVVTLNYTFAPPSGNYTGTKTGSFTVTVKDIEFLVGGVTATVGNTLTVKSSPVYGDDWSDIVKIKDGVTITAKVGTNNDTDPSHFTLKQTGKPGVGSQAYTLAYNGTINGVTYSDVTVLSGTVTVVQKDVTITGLGAANKVYDGSNSATVTGTPVVAGKVGSDDVIVTGGTATFDNKNVGAGKTVTFSGYGLGGTAAGNYNLTAQPASVTAEITAREVTITNGITATNRPYEKNNTTVNLNKSTLTFTNLVAGETLDANVPTTGTVDNANVGTGKNVTYSGVTLIDSTGMASNYKLVGLPTVTVDITKAATPTAPTGLNGVKGNALSTVTLPSGWTWVSGSTVMNTVGSHNFKANYDDAAGNHMSATDVDVAVNVKDKTDVSGKISFNDGTLVYTGAGQKYETASISGITAGTGVTWTYAYTAVTGTLDGGLPKTVGTYTATVTYEDSLNYGTKSVTLTITQATPTGAPKFTKITSSGKTLGDAALVETVSGPGDGFSVAGTVEWVDGSGTALADSTSVEANKSYGWKFTPTDSNYKSISGAVVVYTVRRVSHSGGAAADSAAAAAAQPTVYSGSRGESVKTLQAQLNAKGFNAGSVDGIFGKNTRAAVIAFQKANGLAADGIVGKLTWAKLYDTTAALPAASTAAGTQPMVYRGSRGDAVRRLQELLNKKGFDCGAADGIFGSKTYAAVMAFQKANGLSADGIVGPLTWGKLG